MKRDYFEKAAGVLEGVAPPVLTRKDSACCLF